MTRPSDPAVSALCLALAVSGCSSSPQEDPDPGSGIEQDTAEGAITAPDRVSSVSEVGWEWEADEEAEIAVLPLPVGVGMTLRGAHVVVHR
ncbi:hypothetical protein [Nocardiopsis sp. MG754419]|uniref:hypothetical protein n=1 Tax=Nocardiopsis sp. MG754419 TaxID=2259865 RepID=UPI001BACC7D7|nr:hypothetical protein [Nocardiopsis sp. MG754419]MBR8740880.1 hypothetical protein [Nocardiopsis sp. MG754419]